jgi:hypothetical protein
MPGLILSAALLFYGAAYWVFAQPTGHEWHEADGTVIDARMETPYFIWPGLAYEDRLDETMRQMLYWFYLPASQIDKALRPDAWDFEKYSG